MDVHSPLNYQTKEFLDIDYSSKLTMCMAHVLAEHCRSDVEASLRKVREQGDEPAAKKPKKDFLPRNPDGTKV